jgi:hypothetical protein
MKAEDFAAWLPAISGMSEAQRTEANRKRTIPTANAIRAQRDFRRMAGRQGVGAVCRKGWSMAREVRLGGFSLRSARLMFCCFVNLVHAAVSSFQFQ